MKKNVLLALAWSFALAFPAAARADLTVVEYFHAGFGHYFITANPGEIAALDARQPPLEQWSRTGFTFRAFDAAGAPPDAVAICRFFNASFAPKSSHFYAPKGLGCETTLAQFPDWQLEDDKAFYAKLPDATGTCAEGLVPVYRLYNNGRNGAPNHRFVTSLAERNAMIAQGFVAEGNGIGVGMCVPAPVGKTTPEGFWRGTSNQGQDLFLVVLDDLRYFMLYWATGATWPYGSVDGNGIVEGSTYRSTLVRMVPFNLQPFPGFAAPIVADFVPGQSMVLSNGTSTATLAYDAAYDQAITLAGLAGTYKGVGGHRNDFFDQNRVTVFADGSLGIQGVECDWSGTLTPRGATAVLNLALTNTRGSCPSLMGVGIYDAAKQRLALLAPFQHQVFPDMIFAIGDRE